MEITISIFEGSGHSCAGEVTMNSEPHCCAYELCGACVVPDGAKPMELISKFVIPNAVRLRVQGLSFRV